MKDVQRIILSGLAVFALWITPVQAQEPFKALFAEGYDFLSTKTTSSSAEVSARQPVEGSAFHTLFAEGYTALEQSEQATPLLKVAPAERETGTSATPFRAVFGEGYDFASLATSERP